MNLRPRRDDEPEINLTSLIDVVLLLLVFFMVSTSFVREADLKVALPEASLQPEDASEAALEVVVTSEGQYLVNDRELVNTRVKTLEQALAEAAGDKRDVPLTIRADANTTHQSVVTVMDVAGRLGFVNIHIVTANTPEGADE